VDGRKKFSWFRLVEEALALQISHEHVPRSSEEKKEIQLRY
jgi:hypothetical protein